MALRKTKPRSVLIYRYQFENDLTATQIAPRALGDFAQTTYTAMLKLQPQTQPQFEKLAAILNRLAKDLALNGDVLRYHDESLDPEDKALQLLIGLPDDHKFTQLLKSQIANDEQNRKSGIEMKPVGFIYYLLSSSDDGIQQEISSQAKKWSSQDKELVTQFFDLIAAAIKQRTPGTNGEKPNDGQWRQAEQIDDPHAEHPDVEENDVESGSGSATPQTQQSLQRLKTEVTSILCNTALRDFILSKNKLAPETSAEGLAEILFSISPAIREDGENHTAMCLMKRCISPPGPGQQHRHDICRQMQRLVALLAPACFVAENNAELDSLVNRTADHASVASCQAVVGASFVASRIGVEIDLDHKESVASADAWQYSGVPIDSSWGKLHSGSVVPLKSIDNSDLVNVVAKGLAPLLGSVNESVEYVRAALRDLAGQGSYVCLWFNRKIYAGDFAELKKQLPHLYVLVSTSDHDSEVNATVITQLNKIQSFIKANNG